MKAYRYEVQYFDEGISSFEIKLRQFDIVKETEKGFYIMTYSKMKWVPCTGVKQPFCHKTQLDALYALKKRREKYDSILNHNIRANALHLAKINELYIENTP